MAQKGQFGELGMVVGLRDDLARLRDAGGQIVAGDVIFKSRAGFPERS